MGQHDDGGHDGPHSRVGNEVVDERLIDLDKVQRELAQVGERGIAYAEVVQAHLDTEVPQGAQPGHGRIGGFHEHLLGHFDLEVLRGYAVHLKLVYDLLAE